MMDAMIRFAFPESEFEKIRKIDTLRFETLVELIQKNLDKDLHLIDYYGLCDKPNPQHFFIARMIEKGNFVMTTNFDYLIEHALLRSGISKEKMRVVITKTDFEMMADIEQAIASGTAMVFKIHGSTNNIVSGESTRNTLVATIQAFGSNKEGLNVFQIEPFKKSVFDRITRDRSLVVMGYSGSDDFDIVPTLKVLEGLEDIIWLNYTWNDGGKETIYEFDKPSTGGSLAKVDQILAEIKSMSNARHVYRVDVNVSRLVSSYPSLKPQLDTEKFSVSPFDWLSRELESPQLVTKLNMAARVYSDASKYSEAVALWEKAIEIFERNGDIDNKAHMLNSIGAVLDTQALLDEAFEKYKESLELHTRAGNVEGKAQALNNLAGVFMKKGELKSALEYFMKAIDIFAQSGDMNALAIAQANVGTLYSKQGLHDKALEHFTKNIRICDETGNLKSKAGGLNMIGDIYRDQGKYDKAREHYELSFKIFTELGDDFHKVYPLDSIAYILMQQGKHDDCTRDLDECQAILAKSPNMDMQATIDSKRGDLFLKKSMLEPALEYFQKASDVFTSIGNVQGIVQTLISISAALINSGRNSAAVEHLDRALKLADEAGFTGLKISILKNKGMALENTNRNDDALRLYQDALEITKTVKDASQMASIQNSIGNVHSNLGNKSAAIEAYQQALQLARELGEPYKVAMCLGNIGSLLGDLQRFPEAVENVAKAMEIYGNLGDEVTRARCSHILASIYQKQGNLDKSIECNTGYLKTMVRLGTPSQVAIANYDLGSFYDAIGQGDKSIDFYVKAATMYAEIGNNVDAGISFQAAADKCINAKDYERGIQYGLEAIKARELAGDLTDLITSYLNVGIAYTQAAKDDDSLRFFKKAETIFLENGTIAGINKVAVLYMQLKRHDLAIDCLNQGIERVPNDASLYYNRACAWSLKGNVEMAVQSLKRAIEMNPPYKKNAQEDSDFVNIREDARFSRLVNE